MKPNTSRVLCSSLMAGSLASSYDRNMPAATALEWQTSAFDSAQSTH